MPVYAAQIASCANPAGWKVAARRLDLGRDVAPTVVRILVRLPDQASYYEACSAKRSPKTASDRRTETDKRMLERYGELTDQQLDRPRRRSSDPQRVRAEVHRDRAARARESHRPRRRTAEQSCEAIRRDDHRA
jgi:hypothetical protein